MAKYSKKYSENRKAKTGKKVLDGLNYLGNPNITNELDVPEEEPQGNNNVGQYAAIGTAAVAGGANSYNTINNPNASIREKSTSMDNTTMGIASGINPLVGGIIGAGNAIGTPIRNRAEQTDEYGNLTNQRAAQNAAIAGSLFDPVKAITTRASYKGGFSDFTGKGYTDAIQRESRAAYKAAHPDAPAVDNKDYSQDTAWQKLNNQTQLEMGGNLTRYNGPSHADSPIGGIPVGQNSLVEGGETRGLPNTSSKDYIYSDTLKVPGKKYSYAVASKRIENKYSKRDNDKMSTSQKELEINELMNSQETLRGSMMDRAYKKAYGGNLNKNVLGLGGVVPPTYYDTLNKYQTINPQNPKEANDVKTMIGTNIVPELKKYQEQLNTALRNKYKLAADAPITNQYLSPEEVDSALGGKGKDYYDNFEAYQAYRAKTPQMPGRNVQGTEDTNPKVYGTRHVNLFKPYQTNTDVPTFGKGGDLKSYKKSGNEFANKKEYDDALQYYHEQSLNVSKRQPSETNSNNLTGLYNDLMVASKKYNPSNNSMLPLQQLGYNVRGGFNGLFGTTFEDGGELPLMDLPEDPTLAQLPFNGSQYRLPAYQTQYPDEMQLKPVAPMDYSNLGKGQRMNNFDTNSLYNAGNFLGGAYDIYRGSKGGDDVNYERVTPEMVNPELVNYESSRNLQRRDIKEGFANTQNSLRNVNNPAQYLSLMTANAGNRDKTISDSIAKSYENEINTNASIKGRANEFNVGAKNQSKYFNAQTQKAETDARQLEKDVASNTVQAGLASFGEALAGTGRDKQYRISEAESKKFIGSADFSPVKDKNGKITGYTHKTSGKTYKIQ